MQPIDRPPNIVIVSFDALRRDFISVYDQSGVSVPLFEKVRDRGIRFVSAITSGNWTIPSHASLFSGLEPQKHRVLNWFESLPPACPTLFSEAKQQGYRLAFFASNGVQPIVSTKKDQFDIFGRTADPRSAEIHSVSTPWLVFWHFLNTHAPYGIKAPRAADPKYLDMDLKDQNMNFIRELVCSGRIPEIHNAVRSNLFRAAEKVAALWDRLGHNTIVVLLSDHGEDWRPYFPFHCSFEEPVLKIPLLLSAPGILRSDNDVLVAHSDIPELIWQLAGHSKSERQHIFEEWVSKSSRKERVVIAGPDGFNNDDCFFSVRNAKAMITAHPSRNERIKYLYGENGERTKADDNEGLGFDGLEKMLDDVLDELYQVVHHPLKVEEDKLVLERLKSLGYL
jgi:arylsulfatase A-like enzyme